VLTNTVLQTGREIEDVAGQLVALRARLPKIIDLDFFGVATRIWVASEREVEQWSHFYKYFVAETSEPKIEVYLDVEGSPGASFIESIFRKDFSQKAIWVHERGRLLLWSRFDRWSSVATPLPPFMFPPLNTELTIFNASSVIAPDSRDAIAFLAPPYQGKSTLMNAIVQRGGRPLADNITITRPAEDEILPYLTPTGIRAETVKLLPHLEEVVAKLPEHWVTVSEVTGRVYLLHVDEIYEFAEPEPARPALFVFPLDDRNGEASEHELITLDRAETRRRLEAQRVGMTRAPLSDLDELAARVPAVELRYSLLRSDLSAVIADLLARVARPHEVCA
jgi:hypothetical protein